MNFRITVLFVLMVFAFSVSAQKNGKICRILGTVEESNVNSIILLKHGQDVRHDDFIQIPVKEGRFEYELAVDQPEGAVLFLGSFLERGAGAYTLIFLEEGTINLTIRKEEDFEHNKVEGGKLNNEYQRLYQETKDWFYGEMNAVSDSMNTLYEQDHLYSEAMKAELSKLRTSKSSDEKIIIYRALDSLKANELDMTPQGRILSNKQRALVEQMKTHTMQYISNNTSIVAYMLFLRHLQYDKENIDATFAKKTYRRLSEANPNHPYNVEAKGMIDALTQIHIGKKYVDFSAPDMSGTVHRLTDLINGKVALLNLWATWCGPCIAKSKTMLPLYETYKDKGFTVIAVAGEYKNTTQLERFMEREQWRWPTLVDLDRKHKIWQKYSVDNKAGALFLIDKDGTILAIDPTAEEVKVVLTEKL